MSRIKRNMPRTIWTLSKSSRGGGEQNYRKSKTRNPQQLFAQRPSEAMIQIANGGKHAFVVTNIFFWLYKILIQKQVM